METVKTTRFGDVEINEDRVISFPLGLPGFPEQKRFALMEHRPGSPFMWLQSADSPDLAFVVMDPFLIQADYLQDLPPRDREMVLGKSDPPPLVLTIVNIPRDTPRKVTANLLGPLVINTESRTGKQVILAGTGYHTRHAVIRD